MSQPRSIIAGRTYLITRRTLRRHLLFRPDSSMTQLIIYTLAVSARRYGIQVHALCAMSTHLHLVITDTHGVLPRFLQFFHRLIALGTKVLRAWEGPVWDRAPTSVVHLVTREAVVEKIAYTLANPVTAGLVRRARDWPGAKVLVDELGRAALCARRPDAYFRPSNPSWIEEATLPLMIPPGINDADVDNFRRELAVELERQEAEARAEMLRRGSRFHDAAWVCTVSPCKRATSFEPVRDCSPTFAVGRGNMGMWKGAAATVRAFRAAYHSALQQWRSGQRSAAFPAGTWWMRVLHGVTVVEVALAA